MLEYLETESKQYKEEEKQREMEKSAIATDCGSKIQTWGFRESCLLKC